MLAEVTTMEWTSLGVALIGAAIAVFVPIFVEYSRRPSLGIEPWDDVNLDRPDGYPTQRLVHVRVVNRPLSGWRAKYLVRNVATGCTITMRFVSQSDGSTLSVRGRWSANPEPRMRSVVVSVTDPGLASVTSTTATGSFVAETLDQADIIGARVIDVSPGEAGQGAGVAIKSDGHATAYAFASESYGHMLLENAEMKLPHERYIVEIVAEAGGLRSDVARFTLENVGTDYRGLRLIPLRD